LLRVLLDRNVLISAALRPIGPPGQIVRALLHRQSFQLVLSHAIVAEVERALGRPKIRKALREPDEARLWLVDLAAIADLVEDTGKVAGECRDPADDMVLSAAIEGRVEVVVTGDDDLLTLKEHEGIAIVSPRAFLGLLDI
jgi:hypothetical protein